MGWEKVGCAFDVEMESEVEIGWEALCAIDSQGGGDRSRYMTCPISLTVVSLHVSISGSYHLHNHEGLCGR